MESPSEPAGKDYWLHFTDNVGLQVGEQTPVFNSFFFFQQQLDKVVIHIPRIHPFKVTVQLSGYLIVTAFCNPEKVEAKF